MQTTPVNFRTGSVFLRLIAILMLAALPLAGAPSLPATAAPSAEVVAPVIVAPAPLRSGPQLILTKTVDDNITEAQVGDVIRYRIRWECSSLTTACGQMEITDTLQEGLTYLPPPSSSVPGGFEISYNGGTRTITIIKTDNNLLDGTQYDAVIAVRVNNDLRPLPGTINNTVEGSILPPDASVWVDALPADAPPITVGEVSPSWELNKTRVAPVIEPTVDTDVTYRLQLCPVPPPSGGIADLTDITLTDTLPAGAVFVSASNGGIFSGGVVTWPTVAGPLSPPDCLTRFVTMRYPSPPFSIGDELTNSADVTASYIDSDDNPCPDCFGDPVTEEPAVLIDIVDVPTYSKSDAGDPVGISGTARFILNLNTNFTNYPANDVVLIDNMPPQLQVTSVTSGTWSADFDFVRAYVEYSNNNGSSWTAFPGQPVLYNTNATYLAPVTNITNVRWRFEHDWDGDGTYVPGLPYVWQFSNNPEIRSTPRTVATNDGNGDPMPLAVIGQTYDNCVYVTRSDNSGAVTDPCAEEDMTVRGDFASLRVSKDETPGTPWDEWEDPNINTFTSDATILPGDTLRYVLRVELTERSSAPLINPTILDTLPPDLVFVRDVDVRLNGALLADVAPVAVVNFTNSQPNGNPGANQTLQWQITNLTVPQLELGSQVLTVEFFARIPRGQSPGVRTNELFVDTASDDVICEIGSARANGCETIDTYIVERSAALRGEKWIRSVAVEPLYNSVVVNKDTLLPDASCPDGGTLGLTDIPTNSFTRFPCISQAYPEGALSPDQHVGPPNNPLLDNFEYQLRIFNDGNVDMLNYWLYDILPYFGDRGSGGTLSNTNRDSEFRQVLTGPVQFLGGAGLAASDFTINYSLSTNPCRPQVFNQSGGSVPAGCDNTWYLAAAVSDWSEVRAYRVILLSGSSIAPYNEVAPNPETSIVRFGVPMSIPADSPLVGVLNNDDAQSREIAWNSFSHVGSYQDLSAEIRDLLASEPRKVGITIPERFSIGNRVWRDSDNSGTINAPDDANPGIAGVTVNLYSAAAGAGAFGVPNDLTVIATTVTDVDGYYLFSNLPAGNYVVGIPATNFGDGSPLHTLRSSTGTPPSATYVTPMDDNPDSSDHGIDPAAPSNAVYSPIINLAPNAEPLGETDLSDNDRDGPAGTRRGVNGERDENSDLTVDFGFFGGTDVPFSIGNHVWFDNGAGANLNNGIFDADETGVVGARVELYRDGNLDGILDPEELIRFDITDANGFYLFDNLDPGSYYVVVAAVNFQDGGPLAGWYSSQPTFADDVDQNDNGINAYFPEVAGVRSNVIVLERDVDTPTGETHLSGESDPGSPANEGYNPTGWDGEFSRGRFGEPDNQSDLTIDFGFIPPMSLGNRVWIDDGAGEAVFRSQYNNGIQDGSEAGVSNVRVELWRDNGDGVFNTASDDFMYFTTTDADGYYLFERLQPGNYFVHISSANFASGQPLNNYISSFDRVSPADDATDMNDNGIDAADPTSTGITSPQITMSYRDEPLTPVDETDISANPIFGPDNRGNYGQLDENSNLTIDFGFVLPPRSIGNHLWYDEGAGANTNNRIRNGGELPVSNARVSLYRDDNNDGIPDDLGVIGDPSDDWIAYDITDANGFYLFDNLPPGRYLVGVDNTNFQSGGPLEGYTSSVGTLTNNDQRDNGIDRIMPYDATASPYGILSANINMTGTSPTGEAHLSGQADPGSTTNLQFNPTGWDGPGSRGRFGEADNRSNLRIDFGFFRPMSLGNRVFYDDGGTTGILNNCIMDGDEAGVPGVRVELYRDTNNNGIFNPGTDTLVNWDITDANGYYLFDSLVPGNYFVHIPASNFDLAGTGPLRGWHNSTPTFNDDVDRNDNGVNNAHPAVNGITSNLVTLAWTTAPAGETELSGQANPGAPGNAGFNPTGWDGPDSRGRWGELDNNSNLTIDFGFIPPLSLGNRVWIDDGLDGGLNLLSQFNNGLMDGDEVGRAGVLLELYYDADNDGFYTNIVDGVDEFLPYRTTSTDANGHYLFDGLPEGRFYVRVAPSNFAGAGVLVGYTSSDGVFDDETSDLNDNGIDDPAFLTNGIRSRNFVLNYGAEPINEPDVSPDTFAFGPLGIGRFGETDANSNLTLDFGFVRPHSLGNRVWRDADNSGTINQPDDANPGIPGVLVHLYRPDDLVNPIATTNTDGAGYYLFDNLPAGDYVVGIPAVNFDPGEPLENLRSSTGTPINPLYTNPPITNPDSSDHGIDPAAPGDEVFSATLTLGSSEPLNESDLPANTPENQALYGPDLRGRFGERDQDSNLTIDFGFFGGSDVPFSIGNHLWRDNGAGGGTINDGLRHPDEPPVVGARVELYRDGNNNGIPDPQEYMRFDITDANGFYLFDNLDPGTYFVWVTPGNFQDTFDPDGAGPLPIVPGPLAGWYSSQPTFSNDVDQNDNGINTDEPEIDGVWSNPFTLTRGVDAPLGETHLSGELDPGAPVNEGYNPTGWDGPDSRGRFGEPDNQSDLTIDFGFIPPLSLGNRVWIDDGAGEPDFRSQYNDGIHNGAEVGVGGVRVELWSGGTFLRYTTTDSEGYYLFDRLQPGDYEVRIPASNFTGVGSLVNYVSSFDRVMPTDNDIDRSDKGIDVPYPAVAGVSSPVININYGTEPTDDTDIPANTPVNVTAYGPDRIGRYGQVNENSNLTVDFGFVRAPRSIGNYLWFDTGATLGNTNNGIFDGDELLVPGARISLYRDNDGNGEPDGLAIAWDVTDANGYYLFDNLPPGRYLVGVDAENFATGGTYTALVGYTSSTDYVDNATNNLDSRDNGRDVLNPTLGYGVLSTTIDLTAVPLTGIPLGETGSGNTSTALGFNPTAGDGINSRGRFGETDVNSDLTIDFGFTYAYALGNRVWYDTDNNSQMDAGEQPVENVRVELYRADGSGAPTGAMIDFTTTNADGYYLFDYLAPGDYVVVLPASNFTTGPLIGYWSSGTTMQAGGTTTESESRDPNDADPTIYELDRQDNGMRTTLAGFNGAVISKMVTLGPGEFSEPAGETDLDGGSQGNQPDERANMTVDFGFYRVEVGNLVFNDLNKNGTFDAGDTPIPGATVRLYAADGSTEIPVGPDGILGTADDTIGGMSTDASGLYLFSGLPAGDYIISVEAPANASSTVDNNPQNDNDNPNWNVDNNDNGVGAGEGEVFSEIVTLTPGGGTRPDATDKLNITVDNATGTTTDETVDFGFVTAYALGNRVWFDTDNSRDINGTEVGVNGVLVELYYDDGTNNPGLPVMELDGVTPRTAITVDGGYYLFDYLDAGNYVVVIPATNFDNGEVLHGYWSSATSRNNAGLITEPLAPDPDNNIDSDDNGTRVTSGAFTGAVVSLPVTLGGVDPEPLNESDLQPGVGQGAQPDGRANMTVDFGFYRVEIGNLVYRDNNVNGTFDAGDTPLVGVTVELLTGDGLTVLDTVLTNGSGEYRFGGQPEGDYIVRVTTPSGHVSTIDTANPADTTNPNTNADNNDNGIGIGPGTAVSVQSGQFTMTAGDAGALSNNEVTNNDGTTYNPTLDFGFTYAYALGNRVWFDTDNSSTINGTEVGVNGVTVQLYRADAGGDPTGPVLATDTTTNGGYYLFDNLTAGDYVVVIPASNFAGVLNGYWSSGTTRQADGTIVEAAAPGPNNDVDSDDNGELDLFASLPGAVASRAVTLGPGVASEPIDESDLDGGSQGSQPDARANMTVDFGFYKVSVGNLVWADADRDGEYDSGEPLFQGVTVNLYAQDGTTLLATTTTDVNGEYRFDGLPEGTYIVSVIAPDGTFSTIDSFDQDDNDDPNNNVDDNDNGVGTGGSEVFSNPVTLTPGAAQTNNTVDNADGSTYNPTLDFGFTPVYALGNRVWYDTNNSRTIDFPDEQGIDDVLVQLYAASDLTTVLDTDTTANGGYYLFNGLEAGEYVVVIPASNFDPGEVLHGYWSSGTTRNNDGSLTEIAAPDPDNNVDSDDNGTLQTSGAFNGAVVSLPVTLGPTFDEPTGETDLDATLPGNQQGQPDAQANMTVDFGFYTIQLGNQVWNDLDNSGLLDGTEVGINGVTVELWSADGSTLLATTTTQTVWPDQGVYTFTGLPQANYIVRLPESNFVTTGALRDFRSSTGPANEYEPAPNPDSVTVDHDDNGTEVGSLGFPAGYIQTGVFALTPQAEQSFEHSEGLTTEFRVDFGVFNSPQVDLAVTKDDGQRFYLPGGTLTYTIVVSNNGPADVTGAIVSDDIPAQIASWTWVCTTQSGGASGCDGIVDSTADFTDTVDLPFGGSITYTVTATVRADASGPLTNIVTVTPPTGYGDTDDTNDSDSDENLPASLTVTKDDGLTVVAPGSVITYTIEVTNNGSVDLTDITVTDTLPDDVAFQSATPAPATTPDVGDPGGDVTWTGISLAVNESITLTLTVQVIAEPGAIFTNLVVAEDGVTGQRDEDDDTDLVAVETGKLIFDTNEPTTVTPNVTIGEIVTYQISLDVPAMGTMTNLQALDVLDYGLAFVRCVSIEGGALETNYGQADPADFAADFSPICADPANPTVAAQPPGNLDHEHQGRRVTFDFGDVRNSGAEDVRLVVTYEVVVLNILANQDGVDNLNNTALWTWDGGSLQASAPPLEIVEPDMDIVKDVSPSVAPYGATINFTFDIYHTPESTADAFDVVATDILPPGLAFVPGSVSVIGLPPTDIIYDEPRTTLTFVWDHFPLGETSLIEFQTTFVGPAPVTNTVNLEWTSLPIDPGLDGEPIQQSDYNEFSTERWYDPPDDAGLNTYGVSSSVTIRLPSVLPATGFAPGRVSALPPQPAEKAYNAISGVWIEIPDLGVRLPMLDVPLSNDGWDLTWLSNQAGYLAGTTQPGDVGTMGVTAHVTLADGTPGPFQNLRQLFWGNKIIMYANGYRYTYEVRENRLVLPRDMSVLRQDGYARMTLITCEGYSSFLDDYTYRVAVRAVLLSVEPDNTPYPFASQPGSSAPSRSPAPQVPGGDR